jgi:hypothetical protein
MLRTLTRKQEGDLRHPWFPSAIVERGRNDACHARRESAPAIKATSNKHA